MRSSLCGGSTKARDVNVPDRELKGIHTGDDLPTAGTSSRNQGDQIFTEQMIDAHGKNVIDS